MDDTRHNVPSKIPGLLTFLLIAFINAVVDLGHKIVIQNTIFKIYDDSTQVALTAIVNGLILLPFIFLFTPSGFLSDRFAKPKIMRWSAFAAIIICLLITLAYYQGWFIFAFAMTFILAAQSAIYSPAKYGYIREITREDQLAPANGFIQATTIVAILTGIFLFTVLFEHQLHGQIFHSENTLLRHIGPLGWILVLLSTIEWLLTFRLPLTNQSSNLTPFNWKHYYRGHAFKNNLSIMTQQPVVWFAILGLSLFWGISQTLLATFPAFAKIVLTETNTIVIQGLLACSGIGIVLGSLLAGKLCKHQIKLSLIGVGAAGLLLMLFIIPYLASFKAFAIAIIAFGLFGGLFIIPLNALIQRYASPTQLGTVLAGNNWVQNIVMLSFLIMTFLAAQADTHSALLLESLPFITLIISGLLIFKIRHFYRISTT